MPNNSKDSNGGKTHPSKPSDTENKTGKSGAADHKSWSPTGSHGKGEKKTAP